MTTIPAATCDPKEGCAKVQRHDEKLADHERRIAEREHEDTVLHDRITTETNARLTSDSTRAWQFVVLLLGIVVTLLMQVIQLSRH